MELCEKNRSKKINKYFADTTAWDFFEWTLFFNQIYYFQWSDTGVVIFL